jgi:membrane-associated protein
MHFISTLFNSTLIIESLGLFGVFLIVFAESGLFIGFFLPGDSLLFTAGFLASQHIVGIIPLVIGAMIAAILGDSVGYAFGVKVGPKIFTKKDSFFFKEENVQKSEKFFEKYGPKSLILARFMPVIRTFTPILAGVGTMNYRTFFLYNSIGGILWAGGLCGLGFYLGSVIPNIDNYLLPIIIVIIIVSILPGVIGLYRNRKSATK